MAPSQLDLTLRWPSGLSFPGGPPPGRAGSPTCISWVAWDGSETRFSGFVIVPAPCSR